MSILTRTPASRTATLPTPPTRPRARRIAFLTEGQAFARTGPDYAVFTRGPVDSTLAPALLRFGLESTEIF